MPRLFPNSRRPHLLCLALLAWISTVYAPQSTFAQKAKSSGSMVSGHVTCADTNAPARLAKVTLNLLRDTSNLAAGDHAAGESAPGATTGMDGEFAISGVAPGRYLVLVELSGYVSGISGLDADTRERHLSDAALTPPEGSTMVEVVSGLPATVDVAIERGASVSGAIRYDDGSPAIGILVGLEHKNEKGSWEPALQSTLQTFSFFSDKHDGSVATDSTGRFRIDGVPAGAYILHAHLSTQTLTLPVSGTGYFGVYNHPEMQLDLYSGDAFWRRDATPLKLTAGDTADVDMTIPLGKLHTVTGDVTAASDGHGVSLGTVALAPSGDESDARSIEIAEDGRFRFLYVPEGDYILRTEDAADGQIQDERRSSTAALRSPHKYGKAEVAIQVEGDTGGVTLSVPEQQTQQQPSQ